jgi:hypothetical protein
MPGTSVNECFPREYSRLMESAMPPFLDAPPISQTLTAYDREHMVLYLRLLDSSRDGADWREAVQILFGLDPAREPHRCRQIHDTHLARAQWMTEHGYRDLARSAP